MRAWAILLGGLLVWAAHFFLLYAIGEFARDGAMARIAIGLLTIACLAAEFVILALCLKRPRDGFGQWQRQVGALGAALGGIAIVWQALPSLF